MAYCDVSPIYWSFVYTTEEACPQGGGRLLFDKTSTLYRPTPTLALLS
jgi:hypothetical protein